MIKQSYRIVWGGMVAAAAPSPPYPTFPFDDLFINFPRDPGDAGWCWLVLAFPPMDAFVVDDANNAIRKWMYRERESYKAGVAQHPLGLTFNDPAPVIYCLPQPAKPVARRSQVKV